MWSYRFKVSDGVGRVRVLIDQYIEADSYTDAMSSALSIVQDKFEDFCSHEGFVYSLEVYED